MVKPILPRQVLFLPSVDTVQATNLTNNNSTTSPVMQSGATEPMQPRKRGRKPGPLSRSAREAQRKLNHSIIEKARRTKINEALAALRQLVPSDFSRRPFSGNRLLNSNSDVEIGDDDDKDDDDEDGDAEYHESSMSAGKKPTPLGTAKSGKKREEKEFKLEILERTVVYLQELSQRYSELQMRHDQLVEMNAGGNHESQCRCSTERRYREYGEGAHNSAATPRKRPRSDDGSVTPSISDSDRGSVNHTPTIRGSSTDERPPKRHEPLPPISSWLPLSPNTTHSTLSPSTAPAKARGDEGKSAAFTPVFLPTPPCSAPFQPISTTLSPVAPYSSGAHGHTINSAIPVLSLGPTALPLPSKSHVRRVSVPSSPSVAPRVVTSRRSTKSGNNDTNKRPSHHERVTTDISPTSPHTPEDENAASLLLTMRLQQSPMSPLGHGSTLKGRRTSVSSSISPGRGAPASPPTPLPSSLMLPPPEITCPRNLPSSAITDHRHKVAVETPGSLLGLTNHKTNGSDV